MPDKKYSEWVSSLATASSLELETAYVAVDVGTDTKKTIPVSTKAQLGLGNVNNTSDANKPISTATQNALDALHQLVSGLGLSDFSFKMPDGTTVTLQKLLENLVAESAGLKQSDFLGEFTGTGTDAEIITAQNLTPVKGNWLVIVNTTNPQAVTRTLYYYNGTTWETPTQQAVQQNLADRNYTQERGRYDAQAHNNYPQSGGGITGSGTGGAIKAGDTWYAISDGTLGTVTVHRGDSIIATKDNPGASADADWVVSSKYFYNWLLYELQLAAVVQHFRGAFDLQTLGVNLATALAAITSPVAGDECQIRATHTSPYITYKYEATNGVWLDNVGVLPDYVPVIKGDWNAATNTPTLHNMTGIKGQVYKASVGGVVDFGNGNVTVAAGDYYIFNGTAWEKWIDNSVAASQAISLASFVDYNTQHALLLTDFSETSTKIIKLTIPTANDLLIPTNAAVTFPVGATLHFVQTGIGQVTIKGDTGVTVNGTPGLKFRAQYSAVTLIQIAIDVWLAWGDLSA